jgi:Na+/H+ antiporter NhaD/arsenite permease-like protein
LTALVIFVVTYVGIALTRLPLIRRVNRPAAAFAGAVAMVLFGVLTLDEAFRAVDWNTIALLLGMMVVVACLARDGYLEKAAALTFGRARTPWGLLLMVVALTAVASAVLVNDTAVLVLTPLVILACRRLSVSPIPFLVAEAMASNIGSVPSAVGNPQNVIVALQSGISFERFALHLLPGAVASGLLLLAVVRWVYRKEFRRAGPRPLDAEPRAEGPGEGAQGSGMLTYLSPAVTVLVIVGFATSTWTGLSLPLVALFGAGVLLLANLPNADNLFGRVDWTLLLFFAGLFIVMGGISRQDYFKDVVDSVELGTGPVGIAWVHGAALALSQVVSNVPFTILMVPVLSGQGSDLLWLSLASAATLAGNLTLVGAVANLIVAQVAEKDGIVVSFWEFLKAGLIVTVGSVLISWGLLVVQAQAGWLK